MDKVSRSIFRAYDIRGKYPEEITPASVKQIALAFSELEKASEVVVGYDARVTSPDIFKILVDTLLEAGVNVVDIGLVTTDCIYFASWFYKFQGAIMITASHMTSEFNGFKFLNGKFQPIGFGSGMEELCEIAQKDFAPVEKKGSLRQLDIFSDYVAFVRSYVDLEKLYPLKIVMDAGNGTAGVVARKVFHGLPFDNVELCFDPDGDFPNHQPNPILPENRVDIENKVIETGADLGIAWDADADRIYFIDEKGQFIDGSLITVLLAIQFLEREKGARIVHDPRTYWALNDWVKKLGGTPVMERVGHAYFKVKMKEVDAVFGGEASGHYFLRDNAYSENSMVIALLIIELICKKKKPISEIIKELGEYHISGEINSKVQDVGKVLEDIKQKYSDAKIDTFDGVSVEYSDWRANIRPSANDPVVRLNVEAKSLQLVEAKRDELLRIILA